MHLAPARSSTVRSRRIGGAGLLLVGAALASPGDAAAREPHADDITVAGDFRVQVAASGLAAPTMVAFDDAGRMLIAESGYDGAGAPKVTRIEADGTKQVLVEGDASEKPLTAVASYRGVTYLVAAGTVSRLSEDGTLEPIITGLPGLGDHQANQLAFIDDTLYLAIGTMTNSAVVGPDNAVFGWLKVPERRELHDVPCADVTLSGAVFESEDPLGQASGPVRTSPYSAFGVEQPAGAVVPGDVRCNGAVLRAGLEGSGLSVVAWGLRNPYGLEVGPEGDLFLTMHGFDARGSRPVEDAWDCFYRVEEGAWYGFPDFACDVPVTDARFRPVGKPQPGYLLDGHPTGAPPAPIARFDPHAATNGFAFSPGDPWGPQTDAYIALFGDFTPATGTVPAPQGVKVVRLDITTGAVSDFLTNDIPGEASRHGLAGLEHPSDVTFGPDGAMYVADWGLARISTEGLKLEPDSGVVWRIVPGVAQGMLPFGTGVMVNVLVVVVLTALAVALAAGPAPIVSVAIGALLGALAGLLMGAFMMFVVSPILALPWYAAPRVLATIPLGRDAVANILEFDAFSFVVGVVVLLVLTGLLGAGFALLLRRSDLRAPAAGLVFGLAGWSLLQWFVLPATFPLVSDKGFPPSWYAVSFALFGLVLGVGCWVVARRSRSPRYPVGVTAWTR